MNKRSPILLMLAVLVAQAAGLPRAAHLAAVHTPNHAHDPADESGRTLAARPQDHRTAVPHVPHTCPVCQTLSASRALAADTGRVPAAGAAPRIALSAAASIPPAHEILSELNPRAPPA